MLAALLPGHDVVVSVLGPRRPSKAASAISRIAVARFLLAEASLPGYLRQVVGLCG